MRRAGLLLVAVLGCLVAFSPAALGATYHVYACYGWNTTTGPFGPTNVRGVQYTHQCGVSDAGLQLKYIHSTTPPNGATAAWSATAPADITITHMFTVIDSSNDVGTGQGWWGEFYWNGGPGPTGRSGQIRDNTFSKYGCCQANLNNKTVGWFVTCVTTTCSPVMVLDVGGVDLTVNEDRGPSLGAYGLWQESGWVRGAWTLAFAGNSPSGVCDLYAWVNGQRVPLGGDPQVQATTSTWHQCAGAYASTTIQTADYRQGALPLAIEGCDAAHWCTGSAYSKTVEVDNSHPWVKVTSPGDVPTTSPLTYVTATAGGSPSGIAGIYCSVDGGPWAPHAEGGARQPSVRIPVEGYGRHTVKCEAANRAVAQHGGHGWSAVVTASLSIREPTAAAASFSKVVNPLRCARVRKRVRLRGHTVVVRVVRCHPSMVKRRVTVWVKVHRHGKTVRVRRTVVTRVPVPPRVVPSTTLRVSYGKPATVSGWLATATGAAVAGQPVTVYTAADDGLGQFAPAASAVTGPNGAWTASVPAGPSRLLEARFDGSATLEPSTSASVDLIVPARVRLIRVSPRRVAWGGTVHVVGQLDGGYLPPGGALVRLRIGVGSASTTYGVKEHVGGTGRFSTTYTFGAGQPSARESFWFELASLPMSSYPFAPARSGRRHVLVGGHPRARLRHHKPARR